VISVTNIFRGTTLIGMKFCLKDRKFIYRVDIIDDIGGSVYNIKSTEAQYLFLPAHAEYEIVGDDISFFSQEV
jgi:hypothetical protein